MKRKNLVAQTFLSVRCSQSQANAAEANHLSARKLNLSLFALTLILSTLLFSASPTRAQESDTARARDPKVAIDAAYPAKIKESPPEPFFTSPLVDYLPAS